MDRLTMTSDKGGLAFTFDLDITCEKSEIEKIVKLGEQLKHYEDLAEKGLLVELPCKVGDTIYKIPSNAIYGLNIVNGHAENNRVYAQKVSKIEFYPSGYLLKTCDGMDCVIEQLFNESWFLTKDEAMQALKEMEK